MMRNKLKSGKTNPNVPSKSMIPLSLVSKPVMHLSNVDLPEPDGQLYIKLPPLSTLRNILQYFIFIRNFLRFLISNKLMIFPLIIIIQFFFNVFHYKCNIYIEYVIKYTHYKSNAVIRLLVTICKATVNILEWLLQRTKMYLLQSNYFVLLKEGLF